MSGNLTVSNEVININNTRTLGVELEAVVTRLKTDISSVRNTWSDADLSALCEIITRNTGIVITKVRMLSEDQENAAACSWTFSGHQGSRLHRGGLPATIGGDGLDDAIYKTTIDLDAAKVKGPLTKLLTCELYLFEGLFNGPAQLAVDEITAILIHEVGHMFNSFMTLGDYVWLNYYLSEGVEVLLGKKPNKYQLELLTPRGLDKYVTDPEERKRLQTDPTEASLRRALLTAFRKAPRHYLTSKDFDNSRRREEQLADLFCSRMGYARAMVTGFNKMERYYGTRFLRTPLQHAMMETFKVLNVLLGVATIAVGGFGLIYLLCIRAFTYENPGAASYDVIPERLTKMRRDLVAQLKAYQSQPALREAVVEDIEIIDKILVSYTTQRTAWQVFTQLLSSERRRNWQLQKQEEVLESLMHNDLFVVTQRFDQLNKPRA